MVTSRIYQTLFYQSNTLLVSNEGETGQHCLLEYVNNMSNNTAGTSNALNGSTRLQFFLVFVAFPNTLHWFSKLIIPL